MLHSENGILNVGPKPLEGEEDWDLINAGKMPITLAKGGSFFDSGTSFSMMRGGHLDIAVLGAFEVSHKGDLANWSTGEGKANGAPPAVGGAVDLAVGAKAIWIMMEHVTKSGAPRIVEACSLPLTATGVVSRIFTNHAVIAVNEKGLVVEAMIEGMAFDELQKITGAPLTSAPRLRVIKEDGSVVGATS
jgi:3-oxoadipate CoA-transferase beta subunit